MARKSASKKRTEALKPRGKQTLKNLSQEDLRSLIERRAYELYLRRGCMNGDDLGDWFQAEKFVREGLK